MAPPPQRALVSGPKCSHFPTDSNLHLMPRVVDQASDIPDSRGPLRLSIVGIIKSPNDYLLKPIPRAFLKTRSHFNLFLLFWCSNVDKRSSGSTRWYGNHRRPKYPRPIAAKMSSARIEPGTSWISLMSHFRMPLHHRLTPGLSSID